jgi:hypothetical protein
MLHLINQIPGLNKISHGTNSTMKKIRFPAKPRFAAWTDTLRVGRGSKKRMESQDGGSEGS